MSAGEDTRDRLPRLDDYVSGAMGSADAERFEEALFEEVAQTGAEDEALAFLDRLARVGRHLDARHTFHPAVTRAEVEAMLRSGRRVAYVDLGRGDVPEVRYSRSAEQLVLRLEVDLDGVDAVDVEIEISEEGILKTLRDIPFDRRDGAIHVCCEMPLAELSAQAPATWRVVARAGGRRRALAELTIPTVLTD